MSADLPPSPPAQVEPQGPAYPFLGLTFSGDHQAISQLRSFAERIGVKLGRIERQGDIEAVRMPPDKSVTDPAFIALINEAQSGRLGKLRTAIITGPPPTAR